jgi:hypothetical protein
MICEIISPILEFVGWLTVGTLIAILLWCSWEFLFWRIINWWVIKNDFIEACRIMAVEKRKKEKVKS